ncbi:uncharacterized protein LOC123511093 [Portunus trituberculatus]|uniref:uncharacterized protein LOC123511093 n=1 Tax=Portunus trituberculatus TaxID=210409 RepID=UPI001E1CF2BA|nr:uncharacterized protein LOC123511093 [Portunus trituberculatus]
MSVELVEEGDVVRVYQYDTPGTYTVKAWVRIGSVKYYADDVDIEVTAPPLFRMGTTFDRGAELHSGGRQFSNYSSGVGSGQFTWFIDFGDGGTEEEGLHTGDVVRVYQYDTPGTYTVKAWVRIGSVKYYADDVDIEVTAPPEQHLIVEPNSIVAGGSSVITLQVLDQGQFTWFIDFGDGGTEEEGPHTGDVVRVYQYDTPGTYTVKAWVRIGSVTYYAEDVDIEVTAPPNVHLSVDPHSLEAGTIAYITLLVSEPGPFLWFIDYGDGSTDDKGPHSGVVELFHTYNDPGTYTVSAWITIGTETYYAEDVHVHVYAPSPP